MGGRAGRGARQSAVLRQRVTQVVVALGEQLLLLVGAGQRGAAGLGSHVQGGVHWVGEVSGLQDRERDMDATSRAQRTRGGGTHQKL